MKRILRFILLMLSVPLLGVGVGCAVLQPFSSSRSQSYQWIYTEAFVADSPPPTYGYTTEHILRCGYGDGRVGAFYWRRGVGRLAGPAFWLSHRGQRWTTNNATGDRSNLTLAGHSILGSHRVTHGFLLPPWCIALVSYTLGLGCIATRRALAPTPQDHPLRRR